MICPTCRIAMVMFKHFGGGVYWYCQKCGCTVESTSCEDYSDWVERPKLSEMTEERTCLDCKHCNLCYRQRHQGSNKACKDIELVKW